MAKAPPKKATVKRGKAAAKDAPSRKASDVTKKTAKKPRKTKPKTPVVSNSQTARDDNKAALKLLRTPGHGSSWGRWLLKWCVIACAILILVPVALTLIYKPSGVRPVSTLMMGKSLTGNNVKRDWVPLGAVAPALWQSVMMSEDGQFCAHSGVDWAQVNLVIDDVMEGEKVRGASTISMQTVKNVYLWPSRSYVRKVLEVPLAMLVDFVWGKKRVMEIYLNIAEWGPGIFGIEAAAQHHFKRSAKRLSRRQAALLAVTLPNPHLRNPRKPSRGMKRLARLVEKRAKASGAYIGCLR